MRAARWTVVFVGLLVAGACGGQAAVDDPFSAGRGGSSGGGSEGSLRVTVRNDNFNDATIYALSPGNRRRLGRVGGNSSAQFRLPWSATNEVRFEVDVLGGQRCTTRSLAMSPGSAVVVTIDSSRRPRADGRVGICDAERGR